VAGRVLLETLVLAALWLALTEGRVDAWWLGVAVIAAAVAAGLAVRPGPARAIPLRGVLAFVPWFLRESVRGAVDVARRAFAPDPALHPAMVEYRTRLAEGAARVWFADVVSLLPGTVSVELAGDRVRIHVLAAGPQVDDELRVLEDRVAALFPAGGAA
jgi:multicomponent Na+:H+ antiporter subunit E